MLVHTSLVYGVVVGLMVGMLQELCVCQEAAHPVLEAISKLEGNMDIIEAAVARLDVESEHLIQHLGLTAGLSSR